MIKRLLFITLFLFSGLVQAEDSQRIDVPHRFINQRAGTIEALPLKSIMGTVASGATGEAVAAVTGKRIRLMGAFLQSNATTNVGTIIFRNASGAGTILASMGTTSRDGGIGPVILPITESGYFETATSAALYVEGAVQNQQFTLFYVIYTP